MIVECVLPARQYHNLSTEAHEQLLELLPGTKVVSGGDTENVIGAVVSAEAILDRRRVRARLRLHDDDEAAAEAARQFNDDEAFFGLDMAGSVTRGKPQDWPNAPEEAQKRLVHVHSITQVKAVVLYHGASDPQYNPPVEATA